VPNQVVRVLEGCEGVRSEYLSFVRSEVSPLVFLSLPARSYLTFPFFFPAVSCEKWFCYELKPSLRC